MKKGISPLIASVILIAFVVAVATVVATFFTDIAGEWGEDIEGAQPVVCAMLNIDIVDFSAEINGEDNNASLSFRSTGSSLKGVAVNIYSNDIHSGSIDLESEPYGEGPVGEGETITVDLKEEGVIDSEDIGELQVEDTVEIVSLDCPGVTEEYDIQEDDI